MTAGEGNAGGGFDEINVDEETEEQKL